MSKQVSIVMAGGGTAGHVSPLLAMADAIRDLEPGARITVVGTSSGLETRLVPAAGYPLELVERAPAPRRPDLDALRFPARWLKAKRQARDILARAAADVVVGVGGYVCTPVYNAAQKANVPVVVHEANVRAGLANKVGAKHAAVVGAAFDGTGLPGARIVGMPMRSAIASLDRAAGRAGARERFGLDQQKPTLVVTGGSSGAASVNRALQGAITAITAAGIQVLHITGHGKQVLGEEGKPLTVPGYLQVEYVDGMEDAYAAADLLLCRSGAGTVCEIAAVGLPSILVPLPFGNGEQKLNGAPLADAGGAVMVEDKDLTPDWLARTVLAILGDTQRLEEMSRAAAAFGRPHAAQDMAQLILDAARGAAGAGDAGTHEEKNR
ncbi:MAG: undecaprenyldiphospho-muramoylpentapeptide beta-N-acetylglucosaminyltransferase [Galactobacter sp.]